MDTENEVRRRIGKTSDEKNEVRKNSAEYTYQTGDKHETKKSQVETKYQDDRQLVDDYSDIENDDNDDDDFYHQIYFQGIMHEPLFKNEIDPLLKETHITSRGAIIMLLVAAALMLCYSITGLIQALAYRGATDHPVTSTVDDFYHLYGPDGKMQFRFSEIYFGRVG